MKNAIGYFEEEGTAYQLATTLMWALPVTAFALAIVDIVTVMAYKNFLDPWRIITKSNLETQDRTTKL